MADIIDETLPADTVLASELPSYLRAIAVLLNLLNDAIIALGSVVAPPVPTRIIAANYQVLVTDLFIFANAAVDPIIVALPDVAELVGAYAGYNVWIKKTDSSANVVTIISFNVGVTIDGEASLVLTLQNESALINFDGTNFRQLI